MLRDPANVRVVFAQQQREIQEPPATNGGERLWRPRRTEWLAARAFLVRSHASAFQPDSTLGAMPEGASGSPVAHRRRSGPTNIRADVGARCARPGSALNGVARERFFDERANVARNAAAGE